MGKNYFSFIYSGGKALDKTIYIKKALFTIAITVSLISVGAAFTAVSALNRLTNMEKELYGQVLATPDESQREIYIIKELDGFIAVFDGNGDLLKTTDINTKTLPASDRKLLKEGITVSEREELYEILSDYDT